MQRRFLRSLYNSRSLFAKQSRLCVLNQRYLSTTTFLKDNKVEKEEEQQMFEEEFDDSFKNEKRQPRQRRERDYSKRIFVKNLSWNTTWQELKEHFQQIGTVQFATVLMNRATGRSRGLGVVEFSTAEECQRALEELQHTMLDNRTLTIQQEEPPKPGAGQMGPAVGKGVEAKGKQLHVSNIAYVAQDGDLKQIFENFGTVEYSQIAKRGDGSSRGFGKVVMSTEDEAEKAVEGVNGGELGGRTLKVQLDSFPNAN